MKTQAISLDLVRTDGGTQMRFALDDEVCTDYRDKWLAGIEFDPVEVFHDGAAYWLADGFHRFFGARQAKRSSIPCRIHQGTNREAILFAAGANAGHGLRRTNIDKRMAVTALLKDEEWAQWSDYKIAEQAAVSHELVRDARKQLADSASSSAAAKANGKPRIGRDGKRRKVHQKSAVTPRKIDPNGPKTPDISKQVPLPIPAKERLSLADAISELNTVIEEIQGIWPLDQMETLPVKLRKIADQIEKKVLPGT